LTIEISEEAGVRSLHFGSDWVQGAMRVARPYALELEYTREMMAALLLRPRLDRPRRALLIGLGAGSLTKFLYRYRPQAKLTAVEIDPAVAAAARQYFKLPDDPARLRVVIADGADFVAGDGPSYDLILVDGFDANARPGQLDTPSFYLNCKSRLSDEGIFAVNLLSRRKGFSVSLERIASAFDGRTLTFPRCTSGNVIAFAATGEAVKQTAADLKVAALALKKETGLNLLPTLVRLAEAGVYSDGALML
jgi:spermidine synthase